MDFVTPKVVRDNIEGNRLIPLPEEMRRIVGAPSFQRLRSIKQNGVTSFVFPGAEHSRFTHSLGVYGTARQALTVLKESDTSRAFDGTLAALDFTDTRTEKSFYIAALCHDIGHTAFSHALEGTLLPSQFKGSHEQATIALLNKDTQLQAAINSCGDVNAVEKFISGGHANLALNSLISGAFDVDRCDYILRDSALAGVECRFDLKWLLRSLTLGSSKNGAPQIVLDGKRGLDALRQFLLARRYMYRQVYYHKSVRGMQLLLKSLLDRLKDSPLCVDLLHACPPSLRHLSKSDSPTLDDLVNTTDHEVMYLVRLCANSKNSDPISKYLATSFLTRNVPTPYLDNGRSREDYDKLEKLRISAYQPEFPFSSDSVTPETVEEIRQAVANELIKLSLPRELCNYLVKLDEPSYETTFSDDFFFKFGSRYLTLSEIDDKVAGFNPMDLLEHFVCRRLYVPAECKHVVIS
jgi:uncharacterized protein